MKSKRLLMLIAAFSFGTTLSASAQTYVYLTGSTAFRSATHNAIRNIMPDEVFGYTGSSFGSASQAIFRGTVGGNLVVIKTSWSGSVGGVQTVSQGLNVNFLADPVDAGGGNFTVGGVTLTAGGTASLAAGAVASIPDIAMADNLQAVTPFTTPVLTSTKVGVVAFAWVASTEAPAGLDNMTPQLAQALFLNGQLPLSLWTGNAADASTTVFAAGRDPDSGTRTVTFAESGIGVATLVNQYQPTISGTAVTSHILWPISTVNGITFPEGDGGYSSGGTLVGVMRKTTMANLGGVYVSYMGISDATNAIAAADATGSPAKQLKYNGVDYSLTNVQQGKYTFWGYEYLMHKSSLSGVKLSVATTLKNQIINTDAPIKLSSMAVSRPIDGGLVTP